jgi:hypothetical protein
MAINCGNRSLTNDQYLVDQDGSVPFDLPVIRNTLAIQTISWQFKWASGVAGKFIWEASLFPDPYCWEPLVSCQVVELDTLSQLPLLSGIVVLPEVWHTVEYIKPSWVPSAGGSSGLIQGAIRVVPL